MISIALFYILLQLDLVSSVSLSSNNDNVFLKSDIAITSHFSSLAYSNPVPAKVSLALNGSCTTWTHVDRIENQDTATLADIWSQGSVIMVAFRGTQFQTLDNIKTNIDKDLVPCSKIAPSCMGLVHEGFHDAYMSVQQQLKASIAKQNSVKSVYMTGHSLGASLATLATIDMTDNDQTPVSLINFGSPKVGDSQFREHFLSTTQSAGTSFLRIRTREKLQPLQLPFQVMAFNYNAESKDDVPFFPVFGPFEHIIPETFLDLDSESIWPKPLKMHQITTYAGSAISMLPPNQQSLSCNPNPM